jgi:hypothetical protein
MPIALADTGMKTFSGERKHVKVLDVHQVGIRFECDNSEGEALGEIS